MRNLDECKAEVYRRSEERIKKRKKHRLALGTTFVMGITVCSVLAKSGILNLSSENAEFDNQLVWEDEIPNQDQILDANDTQNQDTQEVQESTECSYVEVEIVTAYGKPQMESHVVNDKTQVVELFELIQSIFDNEEDVLREEMQDDFEAFFYQNGNQNSNEDALNDLSSGGTLRNTDYVIRFKSEDGMFWNYALKNGVLLDFTKEKVLILTEEELSDLIAAMGMED